MNPEQNHRFSPAQLSIIIVLSLIFLVVLAGLALDVKTLKYSGMFGSSFLGMHHRIVPASVARDQIAGWMTFHYINYVFHLPPQYLVAQLKITDPAYPNLTLAKYAGSHNLNIASFLQSVRTAVASTPATP